MGWVKELGVCSMMFCLIMISRRCQRMIVLMLLIAFFVAKNAHCDDLKDALSDRF